MLSGVFWFQVMDQAWCAESLRRCSPSRKFSRTMSANGLICFVSWNFKMLPHCHVCCIMCAQIFFSLLGFLLTGALGSFFIAMYCHEVVYKLTCGSFLISLLMKYTRLISHQLFFFSHIIKNRNVRYFSSAFLRLWLKPQIMFWAIFGVASLIQTHHG